RLGFRLFSALAVVACGAASKDFRLDEPHVRMLSGDEPTAAVAFAARRGARTGGFAQQQLREALRELELSHALGAVQQQCMRRAPGQAEQAVPRFLLERKVRHRCACSRCLSSSLRICSIEALPSMRFTLPGSSLAILP